MAKWTRREFIPLLGSGIAASTFISAASSETSSSKYEQVVPPLIRPKALKKGDVIGICAPAGALRSENEITLFTTELESMGFQVKVGPNATNRSGYFAGTDAERASDFMGFIEDAEVRGIFFLRGGWGCARLLPLLDFNTIRLNPKVILGFSDITTLLNAITRRSNLITFHGPTGNSTWNTFSKNSLENVLMHSNLERFKNSNAGITYSSGTAEGPLWGGNLSVIVSLIGTDSLPEFDDGILFLEDVGEEPYRIDRMLTQLKLAGVFSETKGVVLGAFRKCTAEEPDRSFTLEEVFEQHFKDVGFPVYSGADIGHTLNKCTIPIGTNARIDADKQVFALLEKAVE